MGLVVGAVVMVRVVGVGMGVGMLHAVVAVDMGVLVAVLHGNRSYPRT